MLRHSSINNRHRSSSLLAKLQTSAVIRSIKWHNLIFVLLMVFFLYDVSYMSRDMSKPTMWLCAQRRLIRLGACPVWSEASLSVLRNVWSLATHWAHSEDSDQTGWMPRLIRVFAGRTLILLVLSCRSSHKKITNETSLVFFVCDSKHPNYICFEKLPKLSSHSSGHKKCRCNNNRSNFPCLSLPSRNLSPDPSIPWCCTSFTLLIPIDMRGKTQIRPFLDVA